MPQELREVTAVVAAFQLADLEVCLPHLLLLCGYVEPIMEFPRLEREPLLGGGHRLLWRCRKRFNINRSEFFDLLTFFAHLEIRLLEYMRNLQSFPCFVR